MTFSLDVYDATNTTLQGTLTQAHAIGFLDDLTIPGFARFQLDAAATADLAMCSPRRIVRFRTGATPGDGDVFAGIIQDRPTTLNDGIQPVAGGAVSTVTIECRGLLAWLGNREGGAVLYPSGGLAGRQQNPRVFGWQTADADTTGWATPAGDGPLTTAGWPDPAAAGFRAVTARMLYRRVLPAAAGDEGPARMYLVGTWKSSIRVWLDGEIVLEKPAGQTGLFTVDIPYEAIDHVVGIEVAGPSPNRMGWSWIRLIPVTDDDGNETFTLGSVIRRTFDAADFPGAETSWQEWNPIAFGEPGVTVGFVMARALAEDDGRNPRPWTWTFDSDVDSAGTSWTVKFSRGFRVQELGLLLDELVSIEGEPEMTPSGLFRYLVSRGTDRTATVTVTSPFALELSGRGPQSTRWLYETQSGFGQAVNAGAEAGLGVVMERFVQLGSDISTESIADIVAGELVKDAGTLDEVAVDLPDGVVPYDTVFLGDTVSCVGRDGAGPVRLTSFQAQVDDRNGYVDWSATARPA